MSNPFQQYDQGMKAYLRAQELLASDQFDAEKLKEIYLQLILERETLGMKLLRRELDTKLEKVVSNLEGKLKEHYRPQVRTYSNLEISPELFKEYFEGHWLGTLSVEIPDHGKITVDLNQLYTYMANLKDFKDETSIQNIESVVVYGSVLYKHQKEKRMPHDFDILVLTKEGLTEDKIIVPNKKSPLLTGVKYQWDNYGYIEVRYKSISHVHITYRSVDQILHGVGNGDTISESVVLYGLPIIGQERFEQLAQLITSLERKPLHKIIWKKDSNNKLRGKIV